MIDWITLISIVMTALFLFAVYASIMSMNQEYSKMINIRKLNDLTASLSEGDVIYPLTKTVKAETKKHPGQEAVNMSIGPIIKKYEDAVILSSQKWPSHIPDSTPTTKFNRLILNDLSPKI